MKHFLTKEVQMVQNQVFDIHLTIAKSYTNVPDIKPRKASFVVLDFYLVYSPGNWIITGKFSTLCFSNCLPPVVVFVFWRTDLLDRALFA